MSSVSCMLHATGTVTVMKADRVMFSSFSFAVEKIISKCIYTAGLLVCLRFQIREERRHFCFMSTTFI